MALVTLRVKLIPAGSPSCVRPGLVVRLKFSTALAIGRFPNMSSAPTINRTNSAIVDRFRELFASQPESA